MTLSHVTDDMFTQYVIESEIPVIINFWAPWCGPCKAFTPTIEMLAKERKDQIKVCKMNIDENPNIPSNYGVRSIPTTIILRKGKVVATKLGAHPKEIIDSWINSSL